ILNTLKRGTMFYIDMGYQKMISYYVILCLKLAHLKCLRLQDIFKLSLSKNVHQKIRLNYGPAGTAKTFLYNVINKIINLIGKKILNCAWTGIAACLLPYGQSSHSLFKLPVPLTSSKNSSKITQAKNGLLWNQLQLIDVIIWDEAPMASKWAIESVDKKLKEIRKNDKDFGGVLMIFGGDFRQVLQIVKFGGRNEQVNASIQKSNLRRKFDCLKLKKNMRIEEGSEEFSSFLMQIGNGTMQQDKNEMIDIPIINYAISFQSSFNQSSN
ncbi:MAG: putative ATP-dependent DNA helicase PIF1, partial [Streblomastix strix]